MSKRIVFLHLFNNYSGSPRVLRDTIESLSANQKYLLITSNSLGFLSNLPNAKYFKYSWSRNKFITLYRFLYAQLYMFCFVLFLTKKNDVIFINTMQPAIAAVAAKLRKLPVIFHIHEMQSSQKVFGHVYNFIRKNTKSKEIFVSEYIASKERINSNNSIVIHNSFSNEFYKSSRLHVYKSHQKDIFNVLMICALRDYKGIPELIAICNSLVNNMKIIFTLVLDATAEEIEAYFRNIKIPRNLKINPRIDNPTPYYKKASLLLSLSRPDECIETFGLTIVEAMAFGIPCIVPNVGGPKEIVDDTINGYCLSCYEIEAIKFRIELLSSNASLCSTLSDNAKRKSQMFAPSIYKTKINDFIFN